MSTSELSGGIPDEQIYQKMYGHTNVEEDSGEDILDADRRVILKDLSPDKPWLESQEPRNGGYDPHTGAARQGGSMSRGQLSLRFNGQRHEASPYIPDQFLDQEFLVPDPRSCSQEPDFAKMKGQERARGRFIKFYSDGGSDMSIPESGINPTVMVKNIRQGAFTGGRDRLKIFSTSKDNMVLGYNPNPVSNSSRLPHVTADGTVVSIADVDAPYRSNRTTVLSNMDLGWAAVPDQEFTVAKYGDMRAAAPISMTNVGQNRRSGGETGQTAQVEFQGQRVSKALALTMMNYMRNKSTSVFTADGTRWNDSVELQNRDSHAMPHKGGAAEILQMLDTTNWTHDGTQQQGARRQALPAPDTYNFNSEIPLQVAEFMDLATRKNRQPDITDGDIKYKIEHAVQWGDSGEVASKHSKYDANPVELKFESKNQHLAEDSKEVFSYSHAPVLMDNPTLSSMQEVVLHGPNQEDMRTRRQVKGYKTNTPGNTSADMKYNESIADDTYTLDRRSMKDKHGSRRSMLSTHHNDDYNDVNDT